ncbi:carbohydrate kinase family protein [Nonomuraea gerenzanensis]|uniref:Ribokinase n=1 Tax=Nonomuraea gerenzanensis TaxID=93944 RepID=A0A1M4EQI6_9ACTN|nr:PfkB family carbohydrate kinase [Nonomuraea gerenzanensis]UBU12532.1 PfkB family carbohydrate kinase [Nonomuraea gerenzanensis]SBP01088.1 Ribokinase [Nonomuraea gerenzanensis]
MPDFWIIGPIAWDLALYVDHLPASGHFVQAVESTERPGGTGANVATALSEAGARVHMVGYVGADAAGQRMTTALTAAGVNADHVQVLNGRTSSVVLLIEPNGERTIIGIHPDLLHDIAIPAAAVGPGDIVYFAAWRDVFTPAAQAMAAAGALVTSVPPGTVPTMRYLIGSRNDFTVIPKDTTAIVTEGAKGVTVHSADDAYHFPAISADVVDATGAGDAFAAGLLWAIGREQPLVEGVQLGLAWAAATVQVKSSVPIETPPWTSEQKPQA